MKKFKNIFALMLIAITMFNLVACQSGEKKDTDTKSEKKELTFAYTVQTLNNPYFTTLTEGFEKFGKESGIKTIIGNGDQDPSKQISQIENYISQKVDAIAIAPTDDKALKDAVKQAQDAGIPVIATNQNIEGVDAFITVPEYEYGKVIGEEAAKWINEHFKDGVEVLVLDYPEIESIIARGDGIRDGITKNAPQAKIVQSISANTPEKGMQAMEATLQKYPNVKVVVGVNDAGVLGAYETVNASNIDKENFFMGGLDATDQALQLISEDSIYRATVDINPKGTGQLIVETMKKVIEDGPIKEMIPIEMIPVTKENIKNYIK